MEHQTHQGGRSGGREKLELDRRERRRLIQLAVCFLLFLTVFFAKGAGRLPEVRSELTAALTANADFAAAFTDLGWGLATGRPVKETLGELWIDVFAPRSRPAPVSTLDGPFYTASLERLKNKEPTAVLTVLSSPLPASETPAIPSATPSAPVAELPAAEEISPTPEPSAAPAVYDGPALPEGVSMEKIALELTETSVPVTGAVTSGFGWREHPLEGGEKFHYGVDLSASVGTPIKAFAAGTVDYIGESDVYGLYLQLDHGNGIKSFYAHCSALKVKKGQSVTVGETVALSGESGFVTGPHLHFELKKDGVRLEPLHYIETAS